MSRSYRKPYWVQGYKSRGNVKFHKRMHNRIIRMTKEVPNYSGYKRYNCVWDYRDFTIYCGPVQERKMFGLKWLPAASCSCIRNGYKFCRAKRK